MQIIENFDLASISYIGIGPVIDRMTIMENTDDMNYADNIKVIGNASNILFTENARNLNLARIQTANTIEIIDPSGPLVSIPCEMTIKSAINKLAEINIGGLEQLFPIPGSIGGMIKMNAGAGNINLSDFIYEVHASDGILKRNDIDFSYRKSSINSILISCVLLLKNIDKHSIRKNIDSIMKTRNKIQPMNERSLGSVYKNKDYNAWELIDKVHMRGFCINDICISEKHTNFIINKGNGRYSDFLELTDKIEKTVFNTFGITLEKEIEIL